MQSTAEGFINPDGDAEVSFLGLSLGIGDIILIFGGLLVGFCCCITIVCFAYYRSEKHLHQSRQLNTTDAVSLNQIRKNRSGRTTSAHEVCASGSVSMVIGSDGNVYGSDGGGGDDMDGNDTHQLYGHDDALPEQVHNKRVKRKKTYEVRHAVGDAEGGGEDTHRVLSLSPPGPAPMEKDQSRSMDSIYNEVHHPHEHENAFMAPMMMMNVTPTGTTRGMDSISPRSDSSTPGGHTTGYAPNQQNPNRLQDPHLQIMGIHGDARQIGRLKKESLDEIPSPDVNKGVNDQEVLSEIDHETLQSPIKSPSRVKSMKSRVHSPSGASRVGSAHVTKDFIGGIEDDDIESSKEDLVTMGLGVGAGGVLDEIDANEAMSSSENENLVTIGLGVDY